MVRATLPVALIILLLPLGTALTFEVDVAESTNHSVKDFEYSEEVKHVQRINGTVENIGSIGCTYRFKAVFEQGNNTFERFSAPAGIWQGDYNDINLYYAPMNYTGLVDTIVYLDYCDQEKEIESFTFNVTENTLPGGEIDSRTVESDDDDAEIEISEGELLIPEEAPSYWKTGSAEIVNETATIEYDAPIFLSGETITYSVIKEGKVIGRTKVELTPEPTLLEELKDRKAEVLALLLGLSALVNMILFLKHRGVLDRIELPDYRVPSLKNRD